MTTFLIISAGAAIAAIAVTIRDRMDHRRFKEQWEPWQRMFDEWPADQEEK